MGIGEWWHKTAVYFGIADDEDDYDEDETLALRKSWSAPTRSARTSAS